MTASTTHEPSFTPAVRLNYRRAGSGPALVLVHGFLGGSGMWLDELARFGNGRDVIAPDLAGFGESNALAAPDSIAAHASDVLRLLDELGITEFDLLGHSMGGMVAQQIALEAPERVRRLVLYGTGPSGVLEDRFESIEASRQRVTADGVGPTAARISATWFVKGEADPAYGHCARLGARASLQAALASLRAWEGWDVRSRLANLRMPTLVVWGEKDRSVGWSQTENLWRGIPNASLCVVPGCAHNVHQEKPAIFHQVLEDFLMPIAGK